jgi:hypothetical protein
MFDSIAATFSSCYDLGSRMSLSGVSARPRVSARPGGSISLEKIEGNRLSLFCRMVDHRLFSAGSLFNRFFTLCEEIIPLLRPERLREGQSSSVAGFAVGILGAWRPGCPATENNRGLTRLAYDTQRVPGIHITLGRA